VNWKQEIQKRLQELGVDILSLSDQQFQLNSKKVQLIDAETMVQDASADIVIHEDIFQLRPNQVLSRLKSLSGLNERKVHGRKTKVRKISKETASSFIEENHLMGFGGGKFFYGLMEKEELVAVAVFSRTVWMKNENPPYNSTELVRYCSKSGYTVVGGLDKFVQYFFKNHETDDLVTYIDKEWSDGSSYERIGFKKVEETEPLKFLVERTTWKRRPFEGSDLRKGHYLVSNRGNLKLRRVRG